MATNVPTENIVKPDERRIGPFVQRRGDGFTEAESMGLLQLVRTRWRDGWDIIAQLHNQQFAKHNRSADSLKKKFSRLYRSNIPPRGTKNHQAITFAHTVHKEMVEGIPPVSSTNGDVIAKPSEASFQTPPGDKNEQDGATESEQSWVNTATDVPAADSPSDEVSTTVATADPRPPAREQYQTTEWQRSTAVIPPEATPLPTDDLLTSVLKIMLRSQYQRDLDREEERQRREEERQRRREENELRRQEEERRRDEERDERLRRNEERAEERAENRRRHEQLMQMMMMLVGKNGSPQTEC